MMNHLRAPRRFPVHPTALFLGSALMFLNAVVLLSAEQVQGPAVAELRSFSLEQLANIEVTSVSRTAEPFSDAAASIYVITGEDIRRAGALTIPEALRLAPNLLVARIGALQYGISARGFNNVVANKLLVLIDGRTVYTALFSGVFWDQQDVVLEDVDRIEVISGPGATLWGANAVNGVINIITKSAAETQGVLVSAVGGSRDQITAFRYGDAVGAVSFRLYGKAGTFGNTRRLNHTAVRDDWQRVQFGFRADWSEAGNQVTVQGDGYDGKSEDRGNVGAFRLGSVEVSGLNLLARWRRDFNDGAHVQVQGYWDHAERRDAVLFQPDGHTYDLEFEYGIPVADHRLLWGGGYRHARDDVTPGFLTAFVPATESLSWANLYIQDEIPLGGEVDVTLGVKLEHNDYTGLEYLPSARIAWKASEDRVLWASASRAIRAPSRFDRAAHSPGFPPFAVAGGPHFESEISKVVELGYRAAFGSSLLYSVTAFYQDWDNLRSGSGGPPVEIENGIHGHSYGIEAWGSHQVQSWWRVGAGTTLLGKALELDPGSSDAVGVNNPTLANDPGYQWMVRSSFDVGSGQDADLFVRRVGELPHPRVPGYTTVDARYAWRFENDLELSLTAENLFDRFHSESATGQNLTLIERAVYLKFLWGL
jgi:iron complex outermembrane receptor protein